MADARPIPDAIADECGVVRGNLVRRNGVWYARIQISGRDVRKSLGTKSITEARIRLPIVMENISAPIGLKPDSRRNSLIRALLESGAGKRPVALVTHVYFIQSERGGRIKIGRSVNPRSRLRDLQTSAGQPLRIICSFPSAIGAEELLHERFARERRVGEWFDPSTRLKNFIAALQSALHQKADA